MTAVWTSAGELLANLAAWWPSTEGTLPNLHARGTAGAWIVVAYARWVFPTLVAGGLLLAAGAWLGRHKLGRLGVALACSVSLLVLLLWAPRAVLDLASLDSEHLVVTQAVWLGDLGEPHVWEICFAGLDSLELAEEALGPLGRWQANQYLVCQDRSGQKTWVPINGLVRELLPDVRRSAEAHGVVWRDQFDRRLKQTASAAPASPAGTR